MTRHSATAWLLTVALAAALGGCADQSVRATIGSEVQVAATDVFAPGPATSMLIDVNRRAYQRRERTAKDDRGHWMLMIYPAAAKLIDASIAQRPERTLELSYAENGAVLLHSITDASKKTVTVSDPPLSILPNVLRGDQTHRAESRINVVASGDRARTLDSGRAIAEASVVESDGRSCKVQTKLEFELSSAKVEQLHAYTLDLDAGTGRRRIAADNERLRVHVGIIRLINESAAWRVVPPEQLQVR